MSQRELTRDYFDRIAGEWSEFAYGSSLREFPGGRVRQEIVVQDLRQRGKTGRALDVGCGTGNLVRELADMGCVPTGIDLSPEMVATAAGSHPGLQEAFRCADIMTCDPGSDFDVITAMGVLEYQEDGPGFVRRLARFLREGGILYLESRNRLFNLFSTNQYTLGEIESHRMPDLIRQLETVDRYSPVREISGDYLSGALRHLKERLQVPEGTSGGTLPERSYPAGMVRHQYTPRELEEIGARAGCTLEYVVYYHIHPFLPRFERQFPQLFNALSLAYQPLGYTPLCATTGSSFVAVLSKR
ncbi:MAG: methyltransferase domain-containing protein [Methanomicrobiales archaeon]|nr:methyltransferase domain-containing protein [Methanomicrobiales archaeon]